MVTESIIVSVEWNEFSEFSDDEELERFIVEFESGEEIFTVTEVSDF
jgi:hypothetical protein